MEYYQKIRNIREDLDIKQYEFAESIHVLPKTYSSYENGTRTIPWDTLSKILHKLNLSLDYVLGLSEEKTYPHLRKIQVEVIATNFQYYRNQMGLTQKEMAKLLNCRQQTLSGYERGNLKIPIETVQKFCQITKVSADTITGRTKKIRIIQKTPSLN